MLGRGRVAGGLLIDLETKIRVATTGKKTVALVKAYQERTSGSGRRPDAKLTAQAELAISRLVSSERIRILDQMKKRNGLGFEDPRVYSVVASNVNKVTQMFLERSIGNLNVWAETSAASRSLVEVAFEKALPGLMVGVFLLLASFAGRWCWNHWGGIGAGSSGFLSVLSLHRSKLSAPDAQFKSLLGMRVKFRPIPKVISSSGVPAIGSDDEWLVTEVSGSLFVASNLRSSHIWTIQSADVLSASGGIVVLSYRMVIGPGGIIKAHEMR